MFCDLKRTSGLNATQNKIFKQLNKKKKSQFYAKKCLLSCRNPESFVRGGPTLTNIDNGVFFFGFLS